MPPLGRALRIGRTLLRHRLDLLALEVLTRLDPKPARWQRLARWSPLRLLPTPREPAAVRLRLALESLGPVFIKLGQVLSTRRDLLPDDIANELAKLQDAVPPFPGDEAIRRIEAALGQPMQAMFAHFDTAALAAASVAQVHAAKLPDGRDVVVKVIRPGIHEVVAADLELLAWLARKLYALGGDFQRLRPVEIVADYRRTLLNELDLRAEAANTVQLRQNFLYSDQLYVPVVHRALCAREVLTLERIHGIPVGNLAQLHAAGVDMRVLAERGVEIFFTQVFVDNFFHADMHPGNIFVDVRDPTLPGYIAIDCAIMGSLSAEDQDYLARNLLAFFNRDYAAVVRLHVDSGWVPPDTDVRAFERVIREVCDPVFEKPISEISFGNFLVSLFETARQFDMQVQPQLVLLQKTLLNIEGLGRQLYPQLDLWATAKPFMERWLRNRHHPASLLKALSDGGFDSLRALPLWPAKVNESLRHLRHVVGQQQQAISTLLEDNRAAKRHTTRMRWLGAALLALGALLWPAGLAAGAVDGPALVAALAGLVGFALLLRG